MAPGRLFWGRFSVFFACFCAWSAQSPPAASVSTQLTGFKRVYIDKFGGGEGAGQVRDMVIASLQKTGLFVITENPERADAVLRGSAEDLIFTAVFQSNDAVGARSNVGAGKGTSSRTRDYLTLGAGVNESENTRIQERKHEASASVRLVNPGGDVVWSCTAESQGAKFRSAAADVAEKIARQLAADFEKAKGGGRKEAQESPVRAEKENRQK